MSELVPKEVMNERSGAYEKVIRRCMPGHRFLSLPIATQYSHQGIYNTVLEFNLD